jgi:hypothetical protein
VISHVSVEKLPKPNQYDQILSGTSATVSLSSLAKTLSQQFIDLGWAARRGQSHTPEGAKRRLSIGYVKDNVGLEIMLGKSVFLESKVFIDFPYLIQARMFQLPIVLIPMRSLTKRMAAGMSSFEEVKGTLLEVSPLSLKYPLAILGYSNEESDIEVTELTSDLDIFLLQSVGLSLNQMALVNEGPNYEFKQQLPEEKNLAREICAFANSPGGGLILLGIDKNGTAVGIPQGKNLDEVQLKVTNTIRDSCVPQPSFGFHPFHGIGENGTAEVLVIQIDELDRKPCMAQDRVYIRSGPSARPAGPDDIRRLVLGKSY